MPTLEKPKQKVKETPLEVEGIVSEAFRNSFRVEISPDIRTPNLKNGSGIFVLAVLSGKMRQNNIRVVPGDQVKVEVSSYDLTRGRIIYRTK